MRIKHFFIFSRGLIIGLIFCASPALSQFTTEKAVDSTTVEVEDQKMKLFVLDSKTKKSMEADVRVKGLNPRKTVVFKNLSDTTLVLKKYRIYTVSVVKMGYMYHTHTFWPDESTEHFERIELKPILPGAKASRQFYPVLRLVLILSFSVTILRFTINQQKL